MRAQLNRAPLVARCGVALVAMVTFGGLSRGVVASAAANPRGSLALYEARIGSTSTWSVIVTGTVSDHGVDHVGAVDSGKFDKVVLSRGTFEIGNATIAANLTSGEQSAGTKGCWFTLADSGSVALKDGTGAYSGIRGTLKFSLTRAAIMPRRSNGSCEYGTNFTPVSSVGWLDAQGSITLG